MGSKPTKPGETDDVIGVPLKADSGKPPAAPTPTTCPFKDGSGPTVLANGDKPPQAAVASAKAPADGPANNAAEPPEPKDGMPAAPHSIATMAGKKPLAQDGKPRAAQRGSGFNKRDSSDGNPAPLPAARRERGSTSTTVITTEDDPVSFRTARVDRVLTKAVLKPLKEGSANVAGTDDDEEDFDMGVRDGK